MYLYIHIPFCASRCIYCDFFVSLEKYGGQEAYIIALLQEIEYRLSHAKRPLKRLESIYIGGGTPSLMAAADYDKIFKAVKHYAPLDAKAELTFEANPGNIREELPAYKAVGFNRVSIGVQSFDDRELKRLSRSHTAQEGLDCIENFRQAGFKNISIDLMYGIPLQTMASWRKTLEIAVDCGITHISMYGLKVEDETPLAKLSQSKLYTLPQDEVTVDMYFNALDFLESKGFHRYEFSNLAKVGYESRHNMNYWNQGPFWAFGASAHGYIDNTRYENVRDMDRYIKNPLDGESIPVSTQEQLENAIIFGLRKAEGIHIPSIEKQFHIRFKQRYHWILEKYDSFRFFISAGDRLMLSREAIPVSNVILAEFIDA